MNFIDAYKQAFTRCYPEKNLEIKPRRVRQEMRYQVVINQDKGDLLLSESDMRSATRDFNRGK